MVSIIIYSYNSQEYLHRCINSILEQSYNDFEIIVVDDGSNDDTQPNMIELSELDERIQVVGFTNKRGPAGAKNTGTYHASGEYTLFIDSHDVLEENALICMITAAQTHNADIVVSNYKHIFENVSPDIDITNVRPVQNTVYHGEDIVKCLGFSGFSGNKLIKSEIISKNGIRFRDLSIGEDVVFYYHCLAYAQTVASIREYTIKHEIRNGIVDFFNKESNISCNPFGIVRTIYERANKDLLLDALIIYELKYYTQWLKEAYLCSNKKDRLLIIKILKGTLIPSVYTKQIKYSKYAHLLREYEKARKKSFINKSSMLTLSKRKKVKKMIKKVKKIKI